MFADINILCFIQTSINGLFLHTGFCREYRLQRFCPGSNSLIHRHLHIFIDKFRSFCYGTAYHVIPCKFFHIFRRHFGNNISIIWFKELCSIQTILQNNAEFITKGHFADSFCQTAKSDGVSCFQYTVIDHFRNLSVYIHNLFINRQVIFIFFNLKCNQLITRIFQLRSYDILLFCHIYCEGNQCRRHIQFIKGTGHGIFTTDGRKSKTNLGLISAEKRR